MYVCICASVCVGERERKEWVKGVHGRKRGKRKRERYLERERDIKD